MPTYNSPGSYVIEKDFSEYPIAVNSSIAGIVGFAAAGPLNKATLVTSAAQLIRTFGTPDMVSGGQGVLAAAEILSRTNALYFVRAATDLAADASAGIAFGACPAIYVSGVSGTNAMNISLSSTDESGVDNTPFGSSHYVLHIPAGVAGSGAAQISDAVAKVQTDTWPWTFVQDTSDSGWFVGSHAGSGASLQASSDVMVMGSVSAHTGNPHGIGYQNAIYLKAHGLTVFPGSPGGQYIAQSLYTGKDYNFSSITRVAGVSNKGLQAVVASQSGKGFTLQLSKDGAVEEKFQLDFEKDGESGNFAENVINVGLDNAVSDHIKGQFFDFSGGGNAEEFTPPTSWQDKLTGATGATAGITNHHQTATGATGAASVFGSITPRFLKFIDGTTSFAGGVNGDIADEGGTVNARVKEALTGLQATKTGLYALDRDDLNISMACIPGISEQSVQNSLISLAESSQNFLAVVSPPEGLDTAQEAINWHNGQGTGRSVALNSSYAAVYWPWVKIFDVWSKSDKFIDPAAFAIGTMAHTDAVSDPWFAPAGLTRGRLTKPFDVEVYLNQGDRDALYQPGNGVNPIAKFAQDGIVIWGQRTTQRTPSALDRINVRRMMIVIRKMIMSSTRALIFEPNDPVTWNRVAKILEPALDDIRRRRGITEFKVVCDETTNTPIRVDRNELWCRVLIKPTKTAEVLVFELNLTNQSADLG